MTHPLEEENRRLKTAVTDIGVNAGGEASRRALAALAAEPASGEADRPTVCVGEYTIGELRQGKPVYTGAAILLPADDLTPAPPPPPTQGEEETAREIVTLSSNGVGLTRRIAAALRQRADEATEECATFLEDEAQREGDDHSAFTLRQAAAAIRARIARDPVIEA